MFTGFLSLVRSDEDLFRPTTLGLSVDLSVNLPLEPASDNLDLEPESGNLFREPESGNLFREPESGTLDLEPDNLFLEPPVTTESGLMYRSSVLVLVESYGLSVSCSARLGGLSLKLCFYLFNSMALS